MNPLHWKRGGGGLPVGLPLSEGLACGEEEEKNVEEEACPVGLDFV